MFRAVPILLLGLLLTKSLFAQGPTLPEPVATASLDDQLDPTPQTAPLTETPAANREDGSVPPEVPWQTAWGLVGLRFIPDGVRMAPNGLRYHPNFSLDVSLNWWFWRSERIYLFCDARLWGETGEYGVTNGRDGFLGTSKREFDVSAGVAWNYAGSWEARVGGYSYSNLNRGLNQVTPTNFDDGCWLENRYYLSPEYSRLGQTGFDIARATYLSVGYYVSKNLVGNDGKSFKPGPMLGGYLTWDLWDWPSYLFGDFSYVADRSWHPKLLYYDLGLAVRPFRALRQWEFRLARRTPRISRWATS